MRKMYIADPELLDINKPFVLKHRSDKIPYLPAEVISMLKPESRSNYLPLPTPAQAPAQAPAESESDSESETVTGFDWNAAQNPGLPSLMEALGSDDDDLEMVTREEPSIVVDNNSPAKRPRNQ